LRELAGRYGINPKTVAKWRRRTSVCDARMGPTEPCSTVLSKEEEALIVAFRKHTLLPLDDCLYALQATIPHLTRSSLHRCFQRHGISRLPETQGDKPAKRKFKSYPIGYFHLDIAEVWPCVALSHSPFLFCDYRRIPRGCGRIGRHLVGYAPVIWIRHYCRRLFRSLSAVRLSS
jgi:transposase-like protein